MSPPVSTFLFELINFLLLAGLLGWVLFKPVRRTLQARQDAERQRRDELASAAGDIERQRAELQHRLTGFEAETARVRQERLAAATQEAEAIHAQAHAAAERERDAARRMLGQLERAQLERLSAAVATTTRESVARLLAALGAPDLDVSLLHAASCRLADLNGAPLGTVLVESAHPLDDAARVVLTRALDGHAYSADFRVDPHLGAGLRILTAKGLIDASALGIAQHAERLLTEALAPASADPTTGFAETTT
jgi:F-type H+-transporting ATPase subunit b